MGVTSDKRGRGAKRIRLRENAFRLCERREGAVGRHTQRGGRGPGGRPFGGGPPFGGPPGGGVLADFSPTPIVSAIVMPLAESPVTVASSASQPSPNTPSEFSVTCDMFCTLVAYPVSYPYTAVHACSGTAIPAPAASSW
jgi:hypothetical protein